MENEKQQKLLVFTPIRIIYTHTHIGGDSTALRSLLRSY